MGGHREKTGGTIRVEDAVGFNASLDVGRTPVLSGTCPHQTFALTVGSTIEGIRFDACRSRLATGGQAWKSFLFTPENECWRSPDSSSKSLDVTCGKICGLYFAYSLS